MREKFVNPPVMDTTDPLWSEPAETPETFLTARRVDHAEAVFKAKVEIVKSLAKGGVRDIPAMSALSGLDTYLVRSILEAK